ncbi:unnamed protein product [Phytophthora lilii]|uniref:Unnamed protein product n=1 Tax=Phytophthora lilii TaxID=2077276 RepID=A0A9W6WM03_9STRA|nr:unnamed protein product [Phytophthora lilii]
MALVKMLQDGDLDAINREIESGVDVNEPDETGCTPLMWAVKNGRTDVMEILVDKNATLDLTNRSMKSVLDLAEGNEEVLAIIQEHQRKLLESMFKALPELCSNMAEMKQMSKHLLERLEEAKTELGDVENNTSEIPSKELLDVVSTFHSLVMQHSNKMTLERLASTRTVVAHLRQLHTDIDTLMDQTATQPHSPLQQRAWQQQWELDEAGVYDNLMTTLERDANAIPRELGSTSRQQDALKLLKYEAEEHKGQYSTKMVKTLETAQSKLISLSSIKVPEVPTWFLPEYEVQRQSMPFAFGAFGNVYRGTWLESQVVIKCVDPKSEEDKRTFRREARIWQKARHRHVVNFFGACDQGTSWFFVCEEAANGNLKNYLYRQKKAGRSLAWRKLYEAALGLHFLHQRNIIHSDLKCNQILVSAEGVAMLTDFGLSFMSADSRPRVPPGGAVRWKAPECLKNADQVPTKESDVYSFGMCVVEAVTGDFPWEACPDAAIVFQVKRGLSLPRPKAFTNDEQWQFVQALSASDPSKRLKMPDAIGRLKKFADEELRQERESQDGNQIDS